MQEETVKHIRLCHAAHLGLSEVSDVRQEAGEVAGDLEEVPVCHHPSSSNEGADEAAHRGVCEEAVRESRPPFPVPLLRGSKHGCA